MKRRHMSSYTNNTFNQERLDECIDAIVRSKVNPNCMSDFTKCSVICEACKESNYNYHLQNIRKEFAAALRVMCALGFECYNSVSKD
jgi:hypothetical protein